DDPGEAVHLALDADLEDHVLDGRLAALAGRVEDNRLLRLLLQRALVGLLLVDLRREHLAVGQDGAGGDEQGQQRASHDAPPASPFWTASITAESGTEVSVSLARTLIRHSPRSRSSALPIKARRKPRFFAYCSCGPSFFASGKTSAPIPAARSRPATR